MTGALFRTGAAPGTERIVNDGEVVDDLHRAVRAGFFAKAATDTALFAVFSRYCSFFGVRTADNDFVFKRNEANYMLGTGGNANSAALTFFG